MALAFLRAWLRRPSPRPTPAPPRRYVPRLEELERRDLLATTLTAPLHFDFGTSTSPVAADYTRIPLVSYSQTLGYGWQKVSQVNATDRGTADPLTRDFHSGRDATFLVNLPNGIYDVTITLGDAAAVRDRMAIYLEGQPVASGLTTQAGQPLQRTFRVQVNDGQLTLRLDDKGGVTSSFALNAVDILAAPPAANAGPDRTTPEGTAITFAGSVSGGMGPLSYAWDFGDGATATGTLTPTHAYADNGTYTATLTVADSRGLKSVDTAVVVVGNVAPTASAGGPYAGTVGAAVAFGAWAGDLSPVDTAAGMTYRWDFGDGATATGAATSHTYAAPGDYTVTLTATDKDGGATTRTTTATIGPVQVFRAVSGVYSLCVPNGAIPAGVLANPYVDGVALRATWDKIETADGVYSWSYLDAQVAAAAAAGKMVSLSITAGVNTPAWVYAAGAQSFSFVDASSPAVKTIPVPWDPVFLAKWTDFVAALGARYAANPAVVQMKITGLNSTTEETMLPRSTGQAVSSGGITWTTTNDVANWQAAGYTRLKVQAAWQQIADAIARAFPANKIGVMIVPSAFPPLDDAGQLLSGSADWGLVDWIINQGIARYGAQFIVQNNGLSDFWTSAQVTNVATQATTGYQMLWRVTNDPTGRMHNWVTPFDPASVLRQAVDRGLDAGARFFDIYQADVLNTALQDVLAYAQAGTANAAPSAAITAAPASSPVGQSITLSSDVNDPNAIDMQSGFFYLWTVTRDGIAFASSSSGSFVFTPDIAGDYVVALTVTDRDGAATVAEPIPILVY